MARRSKDALRRVGAAALATLTDDEIKADPAGAMRLAQSAMRATIAALGTMKGTI